MWSFTSAFSRIVYRFYFETAFHFVLAPLTALQHKATPQNSEFLHVSTKHRVRWLFQVSAKACQNMYRLVQIERQKLCPREFLTPFFRVRPRNFAHIFWKAVSKTRRGGVFNLGFRCRDIRVLTPPRVKYSSRDPE